MTGSFNWQSIGRVGKIMPYDTATSITVSHEYVFTDGNGVRKTGTSWNSIVCFKKDMREFVERKLSVGDLVQFTGYVKTSTDEIGENQKTRNVDLVMTAFDLLQKHIPGPGEA